MIGDHSSLKPFFTPVSVGSHRKEEKKKNPKYQKPSSGTLAGRRGKGSGRQLGWSHPPHCSLGELGVGPAQILLASENPGLTRNDEFYYLCL